MKTLKDDEKDGSLEDAKYVMTIGFMVLVTK